MSEQQDGCNFSRHIDLFSRVHAIRKQEQQQATDRYALPELLADSMTAEVLYDGKRYRGTLYRVHESEVSKS
jgi:hypothetical protein